MLQTNVVLTKAYMQRVAPAHMAGAEHGCITKHRPPEKADR
jgi:hypothetical protein